MSDDRLSVSNKHSRLTGLDLARGLAVIGMVLVNFVYVFSYDLINTIETDPDSIVLLSPLAQFIVGSVLVGLAGRAAAVFLVLFGIGISLQTARIQMGSRPGGANPMIRRYLFLILGGMAFIPFWEADILHYIGLYGLLTLPLVRLGTKWLVLIAVGLLLGAEAGRMLFNYQAGWLAEATGSHYEDMWSFTGQLRQLIFNGYHPVFPWLSFVVFGLILGRLDLKKPQLLRRLVIAGLLGSAIGFVSMAFGVPAEFFPADTLFILLGVANASWVIGLCLLVSRRIESPDQGKLIHRGLRSMGRLALSHYPGHVWLGIIPVLMIRNELADMSFEYSFGLAVIYLLVTGIAGHYWLKSHPQGPLEKFLRFLSSK